MNKSTSPAPQGHNCVCPVFLVNNVESELNFIENVFGGEVTERIYHPEGYLFQGKARIRDSVIIIEKVKKGFPAMESVTFVYTKDVEHSFLLALEHGAESLFKPEKSFSGTKEARVKDLQGILWIIGEIQEEIQEGEKEKRFHESLQ